MMTASRSILVPLSETTAVHLFSLRRSPDERLEDVIERLSAVSQESERAAPSVATAASARYVVDILGERKVAGTLAELLATVLNTIADLDINVLRRLESTGGRSRRNVARSRAAIYPGRDDLNASYTIEFRPGWWVGTNYSYNDVRRIIGDVCSAAGLTYGADIFIEKLTGRCADV